MLAVLLFDRVPSASIFFRSAFVKRFAYVSPDAWQNFGGWIRKGVSRPLSASDSYEFASFHFSFLSSLLVASSTSVFFFASLQSSFGGPLSYCALLNMWIAGIPPSLQQLKTATFSTIQPQRCTSAHLLVNRKLYSRFVGSIATHSCLKENALHPSVQHCSWAMWCSWESAFC